MVDFKEGAATHSCDGEWCIYADPNDVTDDDDCYGYIEILYDCTEEECYHTPYCERHHPDK
jgi:hypothetical protein